MKDQDRKLEENSQNTSRDAYLPLTLVTGATGYIAGHVIKILLENGYKVRASYRDPVKNQSKLDALKHIAQAIKTPAKNGETEETNVTCLKIKMEEEMIKNDQLEFFEADLNNADQWIEPMKGCTYVIHMAGPPFSGSSGQDEEGKEAAPLTDQEIIDTAVQGTLNILKACKSSKTVKRVVLTSALSAIVGDPAMVDSNKEYNETDWTECDNDTNLEIYPKAKTLAEKLAWDFVNPKPIEKEIEGEKVEETQINGEKEADGTEDKPITNGEHVEENDPNFPSTSKIQNETALKDENEVVEGIDGGEIDDYKFELVVMNPVVVLGPQINDKTTGSGSELIKKLMKRDIPALPKINFLIVDVRDVALAHYRGMIIPEAAGKRFILCNRGIWMKEIANVLSKEFKNKGYPVPTLHCPYIAVWVKSFFDKNLKRYLPSIGKEITCSTQNMREILGITPRELHQTILDMAQSLIESGKITKEQLKTSIFSNKKEKSCHSMKGLNSADKIETNEEANAKAGEEYYNEKEGVPQSEAESEPLLAKLKALPLEKTVTIIENGGEEEKIKAGGRTTGSDPEINTQGIDKLDSNEGPAGPSTTPAKRPGQKFALHHSLSMNKVKLFKNGWPSFLHKRPPGNAPTNGEIREEEVMNNSNPEANCPEVKLNEAAAAVEEGKELSKEGDKENAPTPTNTPSKRGSKKKWSLHHGTGGGTLSSTVAGKCFPNYFKSLVSDDKCAGKACKEDASTNSSKSNTLDSAAGPSNAPAAPCNAGERLKSPTTVNEQCTESQRDNSITYIDANACGSNGEPKITGGTSILSIKIGGGGSNSCPGTESSMTNGKASPVVLISSRSITPESELIVQPASMTAGKGCSLSPDVKLITAEAGFISSPNSHAGQLYIISPAGDETRAINGHDEAIPAPAAKESGMASSKFYVANNTETKVVNACHTPDGGNCVTASPVKVLGHSRKDSLTNTSAFISSIQGVTLSTALTNGFGNAEHQTNGHCSENGAEEEEIIEDETAIAARKNLDSQPNKNNTTLRVMA